MSDTLLFSDLAVGDSAEGSLVHVDHRSSEEHLSGANSGNVSNVTELQKITALQSGNDWYKDDLSHMTTNLMMQETALSTPVLNNNQSNTFAAIQATSIGFENNTVIIGDTSITSGDGSITVNLNNSGGGKVDTYDVTKKAEQIDGIYMRMLNRHPDEAALSYSLNVLYKGNQSYTDLQYQVAHSDEIKINIKAIGKSVLGYEPDEKRIKEVQNALSGYAASRDDIRKIFAGEPVEKPYLDNTRFPVLVKNSELNMNSLSHEIATINNMYVNLLGYNADQGGAGVLSGEKVNNSKSFADIQKQIAKAPDAYKHIQAIGNSILGYNPDNA